MSRTSRTLHMVSSAYRATLEEQDDPILWLVQGMEAAGEDCSVLLCGTAVSYAVVSQDASGLAFGARKQTQPPRIAEDLLRMVASGMSIQYVSDDATDRGITSDELVPGLQPVGREKVADLLDRFERVFAW